MIKELCTYIQANVDGLEIGDNLFAGHAPTEAPNDYTAVIESGGDANFYLPDKREFRFQIINRAVNYMDAREKALEIHDFLHGKAGIVLPVPAGGKAYQAQVIQSLQLPQGLGVDDRGLHLISTNYVVKAQDV